MRVLLAASEVAPIIKLGGLGDVIGSLPIALEELGVEVDVIVPFFPSAKIENLKVYKSRELEVGYDNTTETVEVHKTKLPNSSVDVFLLKNKYFAVGGKKAFSNNLSETEMFGFFSKALVEFIKSEFNTYDLVHCNDWHTGLVTHMLLDQIDSTRPATLHTIHNLSYQGIGDDGLLEKVGILPSDHPLIEWDIEDGDVNFLLQGITSADFVSTVSPSYAKEILYKDIGRDLSEILFTRQDRLVGILNGINYHSFPREYDIENFELKKKAYKKKIQKKLNLKEDSDAPLFGFISRLDPNQKGLDILYESINHIVEKGGQFILLGTGDKIWEEKFEKLNDEYKGSVSVNIEFNVDLANEIYKGCDFKLIPSRFEPCGLTQMIAMWYGTIPVAHATGGLRDSISDKKDGFLFQVYDSADLNKSLDSAFSIFGKEEHIDMVKKAMAKDFGWEKSAQKYIDLYEKVVQLRRHQVELDTEMETA